MLEVCCMPEAATGKPIETLIIAAPIGTLLRIVPETPAEKNTFLHKTSRRRRRRQPVSPRPFLLMLP